MSDLSHPRDTEAPRAELAQGRADNVDLHQARDASPGGKAGRIARSTAAAILIVIGVLCLVLAPLAIWGRNLVLNTDRYVATLKPVASNAGVQDAVIKAVDDQVAAHLDVKALVTGVLPPRAAQALAGPLQSAAEGLVNTVATRFVRSDAFPTLWVAVNRTAHQQIDYVLTGTQPSNAAVKVNDQGKIILDLAPIVEKVKADLVSSGLAVAANVPVVGATIEIADVHGLNQARKAVRLLNRLANWLPWIGLVLIAGGIATARKRRRALMRAAAGLVAGMIVIGIGLLIGRSIYLDRIPPDKLPRDTAQFLFDTIVRYLRLGIRLVLLAALLIVLGAWLSGPSRRAVATRRAAASAPRAIGETLADNRVGALVARNAMAIRIGIVTVGLIVLVLWDNPSLATIIVLAVIAVILLLVVEMVRMAAVRSRPA
jgi:LPXTG-motif cell wall-anchored protein